MTAEQLKSQFMQKRLTALDRNAQPVEVPQVDPVPTVMASAVSVSNNNYSCFGTGSG